MDLNLIPLLTAATTFVGSTIAENIVGDAYQALTGLLKRKKIETAPLEQLAYSPGGASNEMKLLAKQLGTTDDPEIQQAVKDLLEKLHQATFQALPEHIRPSILVITGGDNKIINQPNQVVNGPQTFNL